jgi:hypothetical protein
MGYTTLSVYTYECTREPNRALGLYLIYNKTLTKNPCIFSEINRVFLFKEYNYNYRQAFGGRDSTPVRGVPYEPIALLRVYRAKIESNSS